MKSYLEVKKDIFWVGALNPNLRVFDIVMYTPFGTTYNSYILKGSEKTVLFETVKEKYYGELVERIESCIGLTPVDYIVMNHTEPDHSGSAYRLWKEKYPNAKIVGTKTNGMFLKKIANADPGPEHIAVTEENVIDIGGYTLHFIMAPFLHWPDTMFTYIPEAETLVTCDFLGMHYCDGRVFNDLTGGLGGDYLESYKYYFDMIMGPFKQHVRNALKKISQLKISVVCTGHGPVIRKNIDDYIRCYSEWSKQEEIKDQVVVPYVSAYGFTGKMAEKIAAGIESSGKLKALLIDLEDEGKGGGDKNRINNAVREISVSKAFLLGTPTIVGEALSPVWEVAVSLNPVIHAGKKAGVFGSYGWSGEATRNIEERLKQLRFQVPVPALKINFKPSDREMGDCFNFGVKFAKAVLGESIEIVDKNTVSENKAAEKPVRENTRKWKCLVCGEVFEGIEPPDVCPACGANKDMFVPVVEETAVKSGYGGKIVVIGGGAASDAAIKSIRSRSSEAQVTLICGEKYMPYYRPLLSDYISDENIIKKENFFLHPGSWYVDNNIEVKLGEKVVKINPADKRITTDKNVSYSYDRLIIAYGSSPFIPVDGALSLKGVFCLRNLDDAKAVSEKAGLSKKVVVVGGGILGLEIVSALIERGLSVTVVEFLKRIMPMQLDPEGSGIIEDIINKKNIALYLNNSVKELICDEEKRVTGVVLSSGEKLSADIVIFSSGVRPNLSEAKEAGIAVNRGIIVDDRMRTNQPGIFACGDAAEFSGRNFALWLPAIQQGKTAGDNAAGIDTVYRIEEAAALLNAFGTSVYSAGDISKISDSGKNYRQFAFSDKQRGLYKKLFFLDGKLCGGILIGDISSSGKLLDGINRGIDAREASEILLA